MKYFQHAVDILQHIGIKILHLLEPYFIYAGIILFLYLSWLIAQYILLWKMTRQMNVIQFLLPKDNENEPHQMNLACKALWKCYPWYFRLFMAQPYYSFEIHSTEDEITFNIVAPHNFTDAVEKIVHSVYKDAESRIFPSRSEHDYLNIYRDNVNTSIGKIDLERHNIFALQTFKDWTQDPLSTITSSMTKLEKGQEITLQVLCRPIGDFVWQWNAKRTLRRYEHDGRMPKNSIDAILFLKFIILLPFRIIGFIFKQLFINSQAQKQDVSFQNKNEKGQVELKEQKSIGGKVMQHGFLVAIHIITKDQNQDRQVRSEAIRDVANSLRQLDAENEIQQRHILFFPKILKFFTRERFLPLHGGRANILSTEELASLFHLPNKDVLTPNIKRIKSKQAPPPSEASRTENLFGQSRYRGTVENIGIFEKDLDKSMYLLGKQGTGKSQLIENLFNQQVKKKSGANILIDPTGDMAKNVIGSIPEEEIDNTYYLNLADYDYPPGINVLDQSRKIVSNRSLMVEQMIGILKKEFKDAWGASTEDILRNAIELSLVSEGSSLMEVMLAIISEDFRREYLDRLDNFVVKGYWKNEFEMLDDRFKNMATNAPLNKLRRITGNMLTRNILCQKNMTVDLAWLFDNNKNIVVNLAKGSLGEENSRFLGSLLISYIYLLMLEREYTMPVADDRPKLTIFIDELQNYVTESVADMLAELRKYGLRMVAGHQYRSQFDDERIKTGIYQLSRTKIFFNIGEDDAEYIGPKLAPRFTESDLTSLENYQCIVQLLIGGYEHPPFTLFTLPPMFTYNKDVANQIIQRSREKFYAGPAAIQDILNRYRRFVPDDSDQDIKNVAFHKNKENKPNKPNVVQDDSKPISTAHAIKEEIQANQETHVAGKVAKKIKIKNLTLIESSEHLPVFNVSEENISTEAGLTPSSIQRDVLDDISQILPTNVDKAKVVTLLRKLKGKDHTTPKDEGTQVIQDQLEDSPIEIRNESIKVPEPLSKPIEPPITHSVATTLASLSEGIEESDDEYRMHQQDEGEFVLKIKGFGMKKRGDQDRGKDTQE